MCIMFFKRFVILFIEVSFIFISVGYAAENKKVILSVSQQERANELYNIVKCPVCSGQSLSGSDSTIAQDLRTIIDKKIKGNFSDAQIKHYLTNIYGDDILFEPPINKATFLLNYGVYGVLFLIFFVFLYYHWCRREQGHNTNHLDRY